MKNLIYITALLLLSVTTFATCEKLSTINFKSYTLNYCLSDQTGSVTAKTNLPSALKDFFARENPGNYSINKKNKKTINFTELSTQNYGKLKYLLIQKSLGRSI